MTTLSVGEQGETRSINELGDIVGWGYLTDEQKAEFILAHGEGPGGAYPDCQAFLYHDGQLINLTSQILPEPAWYCLGTAFDVNNSGQIVGDGYTMTGEEHAFLMTPVPTCPAPLVGDLNDDCKVNFIDMAMLAELEQMQPPAAIRLQPGLILKPATP